MGLAPPDTPHGGHRSGIFRLTAQQRRDWLRLIRTEGVGPRTFLSLVNRFGGAGPALQALPGLASAAGRRLVLADDALVDREWHLIERHGLSLVALGEAGYPPALAAIHDPPPLITVRGQIDVLARPMVALVGSRNASALGLKMTQRLAQGLAEAGFVVVSGLARGIDTAAHEASLATGTVAVLAGGMGRVYPEQNVPLLDRLVDTGAALSEMPFEMEPRARDFPRRNRLVSGLCLGVIVVEAARRSGSLITARLANDQGRVVLAVPGSPLDPRAEGTNDLLRHGATLCTSTQDALDALMPMVAAPAGVPPRQGSLFEAPGADGVFRGDADPLVEELDWLAHSLGAIEPEAASAHFPPRPPSASGGADADWHDKGPDMPMLRSPAIPAAAAETAKAAAGMAVLDLIGPVPVTIDEVVRASGLDARVVRRILLDGELDGRVQRDHAGNVFRAIPTIRV